MASRIHDRNKASSDWKKRNPEKVIAYRKKYYSNLTPELKYKKYVNQRRHSLQKLYCLSLEQFEQMYYSQDCKCAICKKQLNINSRDRSVCVDHSHINNRVRQLLCSNCNKGLGHFFEDINIMNNAVEYIKKWNIVTEVCHRK